MIDPFGYSGLLAAELAVAVGSVLVFLGRCSAQERLLIKNWLLADLRRDRQRIRRLRLRDVISKTVETVFIPALFARLLAHTVSATSGAWEDLESGRLKTVPRLLVAEVIQGEAPTKPRVRIMARVLTAFVAYAVWEVGVRPPEPTSALESIMTWYLIAQWMALALDAPEFALRTCIKRLSKREQDIVTWQD